MYFLPSIEISNFFFLEYRHAVEKPRLTCTRGWPDLPPRSSPVLVVQAGLECGLETKRNPRLVQEVPVLALASKQCVPSSFHIFCFILI
jgi:hypothetical protein